MADQLSQNATFVDIVDKADDSIITRLTKDANLQSGKLEIFVSYQVDPDTNEIQRFFTSMDSVSQTEVKNVTS